MELPISKEEAIKQWNDFISYLVHTRYSVREPKTGAPLESTMDEVLKRIASQFKNEKVRQAILQNLFITATPFLMNGGNRYTRRAGYYSCYPLGDVPDSTDAIFDTERVLVKVFQHAGGGGIDVSKIRPKGSIVDNGQGLASGPVSFAKGFAVLSERISQGGKRRGALMIQANYDIEDIREFITFKSENRDLYSGCNVSVNVTNDRFWDNKELIDLIAECIWKSGDPGLLFTKKSLENTPVPAKYEPIFSNPCVPYETRILTDQGYLPIGECVGKPVNVWNGCQFSTVTPFSTGENPLVEVHLSDGSTFICTPYHKFVLEDDSRVEAQNLTMGMKLKHYEMPIVEGGEPIPGDAYTQGFYSGDGTAGSDYSFIYDTKYDCIPRLKGEVTSPEYYAKLNKKRWKHGPMLEKSFVPVNGTKEYCLEWLAGLCDSDGTILIGEKDANHIQICSIDKKFLLNVKLMLTRLGVVSKVRLDRKEMERELPDGKGGSKKYLCKANYRLLISGYYVSKLVDLGLNLSRLKYDESKRTNQKTIRATTVVFVRESNRGIEETFCVTEPLNNTCNFNGLVTGQCGEYLNVKNTACNLLTINLSELLSKNMPVFFENVFEASRLACIAGNEIIDMGGFPTKEIKENTIKFRPVGIGFTGMHMAMNYFDISYNDKVAPDFIKAIQLTLMLGSMQGSIDFFDTKVSNNEEIAIKEWEPTYIEKLKYNVIDFLDSICSFSEANESVGQVTKLHSKVNEILSYLKNNGGICNSITTSQAPTGSISQLMKVACTGIEPYFSMIQNRRVKDIDDSWKEFTLVPLEFYDYSPEKLDWISKQTAHYISPDQQLKILEACQTFNHTAISKTINLPAETTKEDIVKILYQVKDMNLKGITMFRDSSIQGILSDATKKKATEVVPEIKKKNFSDLTVRRGNTFKFKGLSSLYITANVDDEGKVQEVFLNTTKSGSTINGMSEALGRVISVALQHSPDLINKLADTMSDIASESTYISPELGRVHSIPAALAKAMIYAKDHCNYVMGELVEGQPHSDQHESSSYASCPSCGKMTLRRNGGCNSCVSCGYSSC